MIIDKISGRIKAIKVKRANNNIIAGFIFILFGSIFYMESLVKYENLISIGIIFIVVGFYKMMKGFMNKRSLKHNRFSRTLD